MSQNSELQRAVQNITDCQTRILKNHDFAMSLNAVAESVQKALVPTQELMANYCE